MSHCEVKGIQVQRGRGSGARTILDDVTFQVRGGRTLAIVGPSGCGKTTLLETVAGLLRPRHGSIHVLRRDVTRQKPGRRDLAFVMQDQAVYADRPVRQNLAYALTGTQLPRDEVSRRVADALDVFGLSRDADRQAGTLSGGERRRLALARVWARRPAVILLDEPLRALDHESTVAVRTLLGRLRSLGAATLHVTHDVRDAAILADETMVLTPDPGTGAARVGQVDRLETIERHPASAAVAAASGLPMNLMQVRTLPGGRAVEFTDGTKLILPEPFASRVARDAAAGATMTLGFRPYAAQITADAGDQPGVLAVTVQTAYRLGGQLHADAIGPAGTSISIQVLEPRGGQRLEIAPGRRVGVLIAADAWHAFSGDGPGPRIATAAATTAPVAADGTAATLSSSDPRVQNQPDSASHAKYSGRSAIPG